ncbi:hypothetical protein EW146_g2942 [Bondarzewia mesenterica]|uniref:Uncharacterized protein n=1 Tax=Bondarzewia mesenterica TaxID=1095465 RepID=A0A4S4M0W6_9AGAM|nr:hypothetical protein EW146_g2942 [Bondarzewia mesenterica]
MGRERSIGHIATLRPAILRGFLVVSPTGIHNIVLYEVRFKAWIATLSRRIASPSTATDDLESYDDEQMSRYSAARPRSPPVFRSLLSKHRRAKAQMKAESDDDEEWQFLDNPQDMRATVEDYYSDGDSIPNDAAEEAVHIISESSRVDSPIPMVQRQDYAAHSRLHEDFSPTTPRASTVTRLEYRERENGGPYMNTHVPSNGLAPRHYMDLTPVVPGQWQPPEISASRRHDYPHASSSRAAPSRQSPVPSSSSASVIYTLDDGTRVQVRVIRSSISQPVTDCFVTGSRRVAQKGTFISKACTSWSKKRFTSSPPGMNVIFRDEYGEEITRVGDFSENSPPVHYEEAPIILKDEHGRVIYQTGKSDDGRSDYSEDTYRQDRPKVVHLGQFVPQGSYGSRSPSPITVSLDNRGQKISS